MIIFKISLQTFLVAIVLMPLVLYFLPEFEKIGLSKNVIGIIICFFSFIVAIGIHWSRNPKKVALVILGLLLASFVTQQVFVYVTTGRSFLFGYRGSVMPEDFSYIFSHIRYSACTTAALDDNYYFPDAGTICKAVDNLELSESQPLKDFGIESIDNTETGVTYLYQGGRIFHFLKEKYSLCSGEWDIIILANYSLYEKPKGTYHSFKLSRDGNHWLALGTQQKINIDSWVPPVPGCLYNIEEQQFYIPTELLPAYRIIYPNLEIPSSFIFESARDATLSQ